ncbi:MAG: hypothetical protein AB1861_27805 [Cyanobacteriota bacterium]
MPRYLRFRLEFLSTRRVVHPKENGVNHHNRYLWYNSKHRDSGSLTTSTVIAHHVLADHLGGTNLVTNDSNAVIQTIDYYPYGSPRVKSGTDVSQWEKWGQAPF